MFAVLRQHSFRYFFSSSILWWFSVWVDFLVIGWIALELTDSPFLVSVVSFFRMIPLLLTGLFAGIIIDRFGRRRIIVTAQLLHASIAAMMALLFFLELVVYWHLAASAFAFGILWSIDFPARRVLIPDLVGKEMTADAVMCEGVAVNGARLIGPLAAGFVLHMAGPLGCYLVLFSVSLISFTFLRLLPSGDLSCEALPKAYSPWKQLRDGLSYVRRHQVILAVILITMVLNYCCFPYMTLLPVFVRDVLFHGPKELGLIGMATGIGALPGIFLVYQLKKVVSAGMIYSIGSISFSLALVAFAMSTSFSLSFFLLVIVGIGHACFGMMQAILVLNSATDQMRNHAMGLVVLAIGMGPLGKLQMGAIASKFGAPFALQTSALASAVLIILIVALLPRIWRAGEPSSKRSP